MQIIISIEGPCAILPRGVWGTYVKYVEWLWVGIGIIQATFPTFLAAMQLPEEEVPS